MENIDWLIDWLEPWEPTRLDGLEAELKRELRRGHELYGVTVRAVARRFDCDDVLFALSNHASALAVVHLAYASSETNSLWPQAVFFDSPEEWVERCMKPDHKEYRCGDRG